MVTEENIAQIIFELVHQHLIQEPSYVQKSWSEELTKMSLDIPTLREKVACFK